MAAYQVYQFNNDQLDRIEHEPMFQEAIQLAIAVGFNPKNEWYRGDPEILDRLDLTDPLSWWDSLQQEPEVSGLPYLSPALNITANTPIEEIPYLEEELEDRDYLTDRAETDSVAKWSFLHQARIQAVLITASMVHLLFSAEEVPELYLHTRANGEYAFLANSDLPVSKLIGRSEYLIFDPLIQVGVELPPATDQDVIIPYRGAMDWLISYLPLCGYQDLQINLRQYHRQLVKL